MPNLKSDNQSVTDLETPASMGCPGAELLIFWSAFPSDSLSGSNILLLLAHPSGDKTFLGPYFRAGTETSVSQTTSWPEWLAGLSARLLNLNVHAHKPQVYSELIGSFVSIF